MRTKLFCGVARVRAAARQPPPKSWKYYLVPSGGIEPPLTGLKPVVISVSLQGQKSRLSILKL